MASWFTRAIDRITPWDRGGEVQRRQERRRREEEARYNQGNVSVAPRPVQNAGPQNRPPTPQKPLNIFENLNKNLVLNNPVNAVPVVNDSNNRPIVNPDPGSIVKPQQSLWNKVRDQVDANTEADRYRRTVRDANKNNKELIKRGVGKRKARDLAVRLAKSTNSNKYSNTADDIRDAARGSLYSFIGKPVKAVVSNPIESGRETLAQVTGNKAAQIAARRRNTQNLYSKQVLEKTDRGEDIGWLDLGGASADAVSVLPIIGGAKLASMGAKEALATRSFAPLWKGALTGLDEATVGLRNLFRRPNAVKDVADKLDDVTGPKPITVKKDIPVDDVIGGETNIPVSVTPKPKGPAIREIGGDAPILASNEDISRSVDQVRRSRADAINSVAVPDRRIEGVTPRQPQKPFVLNKEISARGEDKLIDDYAEMLRDMGEGNGTQLVPDGEGGYFRSTNNVRFGDTKGKRMSKAAWRDEAERQLRKGEAEPGIQKAFNESSDPEVQALLDRGEQVDLPEGRPITVKEVNSIPVAMDETVIPTDLPETPGKVRAITSSEPSNVKSEAVATQLPPIPKAGTVMPDGTKITKRMVQAEKNQRKLDKKYAKRQAIDEPTPVSPDTGRVTVYTDPNTGQNITKTYDDLIDDLSEINAIPKANRTVAQTARRKNIMNTLENWDEKSVPGKAPTVAERFPNMAPESREGVEDVISQLENANLANKDLKTIRTQERADRIAVGNRAYEEAGGGIAGMRAKTAALSGKLSKSSYEPIKVDDVVQKEILDDIQNSEIRGYEKLNTQRAFEKMWGSIDEKPTPGDIKKIRSYYNSKDPGIGDDVAELLQKAINNDGDFSLAEQLLGAPRTAMTTGDLGAARQAGVLATRHPVEGTKAFINGIINAFRPGRYADRFAEIGKEVDVNGTNYAEFMESMMNLNLPSTTGGLAEEAMSSASLLEKIPVYGQIVKGSNRNFSGTLTDLRYNVAKNWIDANGGIDGVLKKFSAKEVEDMGEALNTLSGRGGKRGGFTEKHAQILSNTLFSGRLWVSRLNILNPYWYYRLSGPARKEALSSAAAFTATAGTILALANQQDGVEVEMDPRSADWGKIKIGNTRYDILGGLQQNIRVASQVLTGKKINSDTGEMKDTTIASAIGSFAEGKLSPVLGLALKLANSSDMEDNDNPLMRTGEWGEDLNIATETGKLGVPLPISGIKDTVDDTGSVGKGIAMNIPGFFGTGVQTYGKVPTKDANYAKNKSLQDVGKQLQDEGIQTTVDKIDDLAQAGDYDNAVRAAEYRLGTLEVDKKATEQSRTEARQKLEDYKFGQKYGYIPTSQESVDKRAEDGDYDAAIAGWKHRLARDEAEGNTPKSKLNNQRNEIKRYEVYKKTDTTPDMVIAYEKDTSKDGGVGVTAWRDMMDSGDPKLVAYAEKLEKLDQTLVDKGIAKTAKYYWLNGRRGGGGRGGRGGSGSRNIDTSFGQLKNASFAPRVQQYQGIDAKTGAIPIIRTIRPNIVHKISSSG